MSIPAFARLKWYAARLAAMSPAEVVHRVGEAAKKRVWQGNAAGWENFATTGDGPLAELGWLRGRLAGAAPMPLSAPALFQGLGQTVRADDAAVWFRDPIRGGVWPDQSYCFAIDVRATGEARGDVKFVWEINRMQFLHPLAAEVAKGEAEPARLMGVLRSWAAANPPYRGVNWFSGIELAMRMVTLTLVIAAIPADRLSADDRLLLRRLIAAHGYWLARYPSRFSSANNHLVAEGLGLLLAGTLAPDLAGATAWRSEGRHILEAEAARQIHADGVGAEQSPTYQAFTMEMLALAALIAERQGQALAPIVMDRLRAGALFLRALMDTAGLPPRIGDDDEGRVIGAPPDREPRYVASIVAAVAGLQRDATLLPPRHDRHLRDAIFESPPGMAETEDGAHAFEDGGYTIIRQTIAGRRMVLTFDHGPLGYLSLAAHGHADALAIWLSLDDLPVLVDAGTYLYHSGGALRNALRASPAHNTVTVEGVSQAVPSSAFSWKNRPQARCDDLQEGPQWCITASHDGYQKRFNLRHSRQLCREADGFTIHDALIGSGQSHTATISFLIGPGLTVERAKTATNALILRHNGDALLRLEVQPGMTAMLAGPDPARGIGPYSPAFAVLESVPHIVLSGMIGASTTRTRIVILPQR